MSQTITLYVDGACRGNPGLGGWGAYVITPDQKHELCGGEANTTNNRMELRAAIEGIRFCAPTDKLILWTDSTYVKRGITEWIEGWKKKNWKDVKNPDLWKELDLVCQNRDIEWNWVKGHAGHAGNEKADQLANRGADQTLTQIKAGEPIQASIDNMVVAAQPATATETNTDSITDSTAKKKAEPDWLLNDPFGLDFADTDDGEMEEMPEADAPLLKSAQNSSNKLITSAEQPTAVALTTTAPTEVHPQIVITPANKHLEGPRQFILDTETTGFYFQNTDRIVEVGAIEMVNRKLTGSSIHIYINGETPVGDSFRIHGISDEFLADKPKFAEIAATLFEYLKGGEIIAHNASFDMNFLNMEFKRCGYPTLSEVCSVTDTLAMAKSKHPGQKNSLDALVRRYEVPQRDRTFHGALLDAEILADVYLAMTGGQVSLDIDALTEQTDQQQTLDKQHNLEAQLPVIFPSAEELAAHQQWMQQYQDKNGEPSLFAK